ncbi:MAG TPA: serine hydrolase [Pilimelia sp.]|nr:serine hydrolase [Pilimelia sp.]
MRIGNAYRKARPAIVGVSPTGGLEMGHLGKRRAGTSRRRKAGRATATAAVVTLVVAGGTVAVAESMQAPQQPPPPARQPVAAAATGAATAAPPTASPSPRRRAAAARAAAPGAGPTAAPPQPRVSAATRQRCAAVSKPVGDGGFYDYAPPMLEAGEALAGWPAQPEAGHGMDPGRLARAGDALRGVPSMRALVVVRHGKLAYERYYGNGSRRQSNNVHSASKSILQALVGAAVARGALTMDTTVAEALGGVTTVPAAQGGITVRQLLTMTSGLDWREDRTEREIARSRDWVAGILRRPRAGSAFNYSTGNTHVLSAMLQARTGMSTCEFAAETVFGGLGVAPERWAVDPKGVSAGGFNLYLTARELTRFGQLYLDEGRHGGRQVLPKQVVTQARTVTDRRHAYSAGWWVTRVDGLTVMSAWGWGGQQVSVVPERGLVVTATQDTSRYDGEPEQDIDMRRFLADHVLPAVR